MHRIRPLALLILTALLAAPLVSRGQAKGEDKVKVKVRISQDRQASANILPWSIIRSSPTSIMMLRNPEFDVRPFTKLAPRIDLYDREKLTYLRSLEPNMQRLNQDKLMLEDLVLFNRRPMLIARGSKEEEQALYYQYIDPYLTRQPPAFERFATFPVQVKERKPLFVTSGSATREPWYTAFSPDSSRMLIHSPELRDQEDGAAFMLLVLVDRNMQVQWQQLLRLSPDSRRTELLDAGVDNAGNAFLLVKNRFKGRQFKGGQANYEVVLYKANERDVVQQPFGFDAGVFPMGGIIANLANGDVACAGIYGEVEGRKLLGNFIGILKAGEDALAGLRLMPFAGGEDINGEVTEDALKVEEDEEKGSKSEEKDQKRMEQNTDVVALVPRPDGGFFLINEVNFVRESTNAQTGHTAFTYYHGPVQVRSFNSEGAELWTTLFRRWTAAASPMLGKVYPAEFENQLYLFLWDSEKMAEKRKEGKRIKPGQMVGAYSAYAAFDDKGAYRLKAVLRSDNDEDFIGGRELVRVGPNEYYGLGTENITIGKFLPVRIDFMREAKK